MPIQISPQGLQLQQQAMGMPRDQMQALLNQQIGLIPLPELLAIKSAVDRAQLRSAPPQAQPEQTTVAQDLMIQKGTQDRMQGGVATLPVANVGNEAAYAGGGIVAFAEGGTPYGRAVERFGQGIANFATSSPKGMYSDPRAKRRMLEEEALKVLNIDKRGSLLGGFMDQSDEERQFAQQKVEQIRNMPEDQLLALIAEGQAASQPASSAGSEQGAPQYGLGAVGKRQFGPFSRPTPQIRQFGQAEEGASARAAAPALSIPELLKSPAPTESDFGIGDLQKRANKDEKARMKEIQEARGEDVLAKQEGELKGEREKRTGKAAQTRDMWLALSQGFFDMAASGKPTFTGALAAGAQRGFDAYRQALDKRDALKEKYDDKLAQIALAKQAQAEGDYRYAASQLRDDEKELNAAQRAFKTADLNFRQFEIGQTNDSIQQLRTLAAQSRENERDRRTQLEVANIGLERARASAEDRGALTDYQRANLLMKLDELPEVQQADEAAEKEIAAKGSRVLNSPAGQAALAQRKKEIRAEAAKKLGIRGQGYNPIYSAADTILGRP
jgi:hypothetical protein